MIWSRKGELKIPPWCRENDHFMGLTVASVLQGTLFPPIRPCNSQKASKAPTL